MTRYSSHRDAIAHILRSRFSAAVVLILSVAAAVGFLRYFGDKVAGAQPPVGSSIRDFALSDEDGRQFTLDTLRGHKIVLIIFTTTCPHCRSALLQFAGLTNSFNKHLNFLYCSLDSLNQTKKLMSDIGLSAKAVFTDGESAAERLNIVKVPVVFFVDATGVLIWAQVGQSSPESLNEKLLEFAAYDPGLRGDHK